jgi:hypothetical protein
LLDLTGERPGISEWSPRFGPDGRIYYSARETDGATRVWSVAWPAEAAPLGPAALPAETAPAAAPTAADGMPGEATRA